MPGIDSYTKLLLHGNKVNGSKSHFISLIGNAKITTSQSVFGGSCLNFDGTGDVLSIADSTDWYFSGDFTIDTWIRFNSVAPLARIFRQYQDGSNFIAFNHFGTSGGGNANTLYFQSQSGGSTVVEFKVPFAPSINTWYHIALVRNGSTWNVYIDGVAATKTLVDGSYSNAFADYSANVTIGGDAGGLDLNGYLDEYRVSKTARWTANFTPPTSEYTSDEFTCLLLHGNGPNNSLNIIDASGGDESGSNYEVTYNGNAQIDTSIYKFGGASCKFDGTGDYLTIPDSTDFAFGTGDFTIDLWFNMSTVGGHHVFLSQRIDGANHWQLDWYAPNNIRFVQESTSDGNLYAEAAAFLPVASTWYHLALVRNGTNFSIYVNGVSVMSATSSITLTDFAGPLYIGSYGVSSLEFNGYMDELRISKGIARWTANFTPPTSQYNSDIASLRKNRVIITI